MHEIEYYLFEEDLAKYAFYRAVLINGFITFMVTTKLFVITMYYIIL